MMVTTNLAIDRALKWSLTAAGLLLLTTIPQNCGAASACDLNQDGKVDAADVLLANEMAIGASPCLANITAAAVCDVVLIQRVINAMLGGACVTNAPAAHMVTLSWSPSTSNVAGYYVYRGTQSGGPYVRLTSSLVTAMTYEDAAVQGGQTYYYAVTAIDAAGNESAFSNQAAASVPSP